MPTSSMQRVTLSGGSSRLMPSVSTTSAEPHSEDTERLPCLATRKPAPATTKAVAADPTLVRTGRVVAVDDVLPAEDLRRARIDDQPRPLARLVGRALHRDTHEVRHRLGLVDQAGRAVRIRERRVPPGRSVSRRLSTTRAVTLR